MRSLRITLRTDVPAVLPLAYNELLQGLLYSCWKEDLPTVHDYTSVDGKPFRPFTFSGLEGACSVDSKRKTICFDGLVNFDVRSPVEELLSVLAQQLSSRQTVRIGAYTFELVNLELRDRLIFPAQAIIKMRTPVVTYRTLADGHTQYFSPLADEWQELMWNNSARKLRAVLDPYSSPDVCGNPFLTLIPQEDSLKKIVTRFKGHYVTGWTGRFFIAADPLAVSMLYFCGLGTKNSQGFGMFDITDEHL